jgi:hypothetical protein
MTSQYTIEQIESAITLALRERNFPVAISLVHMLAVRAPDRARLILDTIDVARHLNDEVSYVTSRGHPIHHGTDAGYQQERRRRIPPCYECRQANATESRNYRTNNVSETEHSNASPNSTTKTWQRLYEEERRVTTGDE